MNIKFKNLKKFKVPEFPILIGDILNFKYYSDIYIFIF